MIKEFSFVVRSQKFWGRGDDDGNYCRWLRILRDRDLFIIGYQQSGHILDI
uniref:Uncharacterized protein n=1 Tax=Candidatus Kentrum sp. LFY TaxID=2126342 RepID=A0A450UFA2_9GAMM|nr:MAG: hypothetical protein BECKLFY1418B_GA0070995_102427 [Candidatus Kentron sp. LFY]VFJ98355.1 MAG: hypothetical protein BECKLFY1418A_GA0070994_10826 [Candidatus Kentron sp. LFY]